MELIDRRTIATSRITITPAHPDPDWQRSSTWSEVIAHLFHEHPTVDISTVRLEMRPSVDGYSVQLIAHGRIGTIDGSCPRCHTLIGRPHTDYCTERGIHS